MRSNALLAAVTLAATAAGCELVQVAAQTVVAPSTNQAPYDGGAAAIDGGAVPSLVFAVVGDTRPPAPDDTGDYPAQIIGQIFSSINGLSPRPQLVVATGDYMFADPLITGELSQAPAQSALYVLAAQKFSGHVFPAMGNHECTATSSCNCCPGCSDGITPNYIAFLQDILAPLRIPNQLPYYSVWYTSSDPTHAWTAKFVFIAANAWDAAQSSWLSAILAQPTTYTFVARHEPDYDNSQCLGCGASDVIVKANPYTLLLAGHEHTFQALPTSAELVVGTGGASLNGATDQYGYALCSQLPNGNISCAERDYDGASTSYPNAALVVTPTGKPAS